MASFRRSPIGSISAITQWLYSTDHQPGVNHIFSTRLFNLIPNPDLTPFFSLAESQEVSPGVVVIDYATNGDIVGIDIDNASTMRIPTQAGH
jgi:hypothetical protein